MSGRHSTRRNDPTHPQLPLPIFTPLNPSWYRRSGVNQRYILLFEVCNAPQLQVVRTVLILRYANRAILCIRPFMEPPNGPEQAGPKLTHDQEGCPCTSKERKAPSGPQTRCTTSCSRNPMYHLAWHLDWNTDSGGLVVRIALLVAPRRRFSPLRQEAKNARKSGWGGPARTVIAGS